MSVEKDDFGTRRPAFGLGVIGSKFGTPFKKSNKNKLSNYLRISTFIKMYNWQSIVFLKYI